MSQITVGQAVTKEATNYQEQKNYSMVRVGEGGLRSPYYTAPAVASELLAVLTRTETGKYLWCISDLDNESYGPVDKSVLWFSSFAEPQHIEAKDMRRFGVSAKIERRQDGNFDGLVVRGYFQRNPTGTAKQPVPVNMNGSDYPEGKSTGFIVGDLPLVSGMALIWQNEIITAQFPVIGGKKQPDHKIDVRSVLNSIKQREDTDTSIGSLFKPGQVVSKPSVQPAIASKQSRQPINPLDVLALLQERGIGLTPELMTAIMTADQDQLSRYVVVKQAEEPFAGNLMKVYSQLSADVQEKLLGMPKGLAETMLTSATSAGQLQLVLGGPIK